MDNQDRGRIRIQEGIEQLPGAAKDRTGVTKHLEIGKTTKTNKRQSSSAPFRGRERQEERPNVPEDKDPDPKYLD